MSWSQQPCGVSQPSDRRLGEPTRSGTLGVCVPTRPGASRRFPLRCLARGFTLVELLIALAMVALITLLLFNGLRLGSRAWDGVDAAAARIDAVRLAHQFLARTLTELRPATLVVEGGSVQVFAGDAERLEFAAPLSEHVGIPGLSILRIEVVESGRRRDLVLTHWLMHPEVLAGTDEVPEWQPLKDESRLDAAPDALDQDVAAGAFGRTLLLEGVRELKLNYYGVAAGETDPDWHDTWLEEGTLPLLVRLHLTTNDQTWPDLIVALPSPRL
jgi:general secretion pathway protein J